MVRPMDGRDPHPYDDELDPDAERSEALTRLSAAAGVIWNLLLYDGLPAALAWAFNALEGVDLFAPFIDASLARRLGRLGLFLSAVAAIIASESILRLGRGFGLAQFVLALLALGAALFPMLATFHRLPLGLPPDQFAVVLSYAYLVLKITVGILIGATVALVVGGLRAAPVVTHPYTPRK
jgi:hypothetical protein